MKIGITGAEGLIGWHQRAYLKTIGGDHEIRLANRETFKQPGLLSEFVNGLDAIIHLAGMNRGNDAQVEATNRALAHDLVAACEQTGARPFVVYANSTHEDQDTAYGRGKRAAANTFHRWAERSGAGFTNLILPHVFGEFGKPFYNSVVSTFCHQLARQEAPQIITDGDLELLHAQDVVAQCWKAIQENQRGDIRMAGVGMKVSELLRHLTVMRDRYQAMVMPPLESVLDVRLFNTLRSYLFPGYYPVALTLHSDARGSLFEVVKSNSGGQVFMSTTHPGITRGNHFHTRKVERFLVASGEADIRLRKLFSDEVTSFKVRGETPCYVDIPTFHTHHISNTGQSELVTLFWANEIFDPGDPDTFPELVDVP
ncbi:MAG: NAD-dependent epimerase/dehydratase family protein [Gammaproteobacteria bacterium]|nr:NAD-dependent epimerase/dehydratase family protein [Rhodocyclaceae bacterium]MBU3910516.1 NAD-dependent epimerase/dehydratase family protein [Gammaproteobacteria bacterium]MBU3989582.1 NAD-dependent epimerase/dehydratase family protein [Gammaproteobacteria bacterium]MBU4004997.1 NAD-dependent epimerase/dehydratase family protein [Gammaproteobacteria bacterium]MBU4020590.1 NAD-dependent epimerase/dehydratase family protein [Gammaproteobacteria bacterium]